MSKRSRRKIGNWLEFFGYCLILYAVMQAVLAITGGLR